MSNVQESAQERIARERVEWIAGWRAIGDWLEQHPEVKLPHLGGHVAVDGVQGCLFIWLFGGAADEAATIARAMGKAEKQVDGPDAKHPQVRLVRRFGPIALVASIDRDDVCERVVTGTKETTKQVPDPELLAAVPVVEVTETVEDVQWVCRPLLAGDREPSEVAA